MFAKNARPFIFLNVYLFRYLVSSWGRPLVRRSTRRLPAETTPTQGLELPALRASTPVGQSCEARPTNIAISFLCILPFEFASLACCLVACLRVLNDWLGYAAAGHSRFTGLLPVTWLPEARLSEGLFPKCPPTHRCLHFEGPNLPLREFHSWASPLAYSHVCSSAFKIICFAHLGIPNAWPSPRSRLHAYIAP